MSSAFKTLKTSDVTVTPYVTNKSYKIKLNTAEIAAYGIQYLRYGNSPIGNGPGYNEEALNYRSIRHLYYSHYLPSLSPTTPLSQQDYSQLEEDEYGRKKTNNTLIYDNYLQSTAGSGSLEVDDRFGFPTDAPNDILSIPQILYGENIKPESFQVYDPTYDLIILADDGNGNIIDPVNNGAIIGNIIYAHGMIIIRDPYYSFLLDPANNYLYIFFQSSFTIYENQTRCHVNENEYNFTQNPTAASGSTGYYNNNVTGSSFAPYVTTIGLYNAANQLLAVGKLSQPYPVPSNTDITFVVKYDS